MFATRAALPTLRAARQSAARPQARGYATQQSGGSSNLGLWLSLAGLAGLGGFAYLNRTAPKDDKSAATAAPAPAAEETKAEDSNVALIKDVWVPVKVAKVSKYNHNSSVFQLDFQGEGAEEKTSGLSVAGLIMVRTPEGEAQLLDDKGKPVMRPYTPITQPEEKGHLDLLVKHYPTGKISKWLGDVKEGDEVLIKGPITKFKYAPNSYDKALFVAGGSGITPAFQLITHALAQPEDKTHFTLLFANVSEADILLRKEWDALAAAHPDRLKVVYFLDKAPWGWKGEKGYVTAEQIQKHFPRADGDKIRAFVCGPPPQVEAIAGKKAGFKQGELQGVFKELGYTAEEVFKY